MHNEFHYRVVDGSYLPRQSPYHPTTTEHSFYIRAEDMPSGVPSGCNPRFQNPDRPLYKKVIASFLDVESTSFHMKNRGLTTLAESVKVTKGPRTGGIVLSAKIPDNVNNGNADGQHTYVIVEKYKDQAPNQLVKVLIYENLPNHLIPEVCAALNSSMQLSSASSADHSNKFQEVREALESKPYYKWIGFRDNQPQTSASVTMLVNIMWACNPTMFENASSPRHPSWIWSRPTAIKDNGYYTSEKMHEEMNKIINLLPSLIELYQFVDRRASEVGKSAVYSSLFEEGKIGRYFGDPDDKMSYRQLRDSYVMIMVASSRALMLANKRTGHLEWTVPFYRVKEIIDSSIRPLLNMFNSRLKEVRDQQLVSRSPATWDLALATVERTYNKLAI